MHQHTALTAFFFLFFFFQQQCHDSCPVITLTNIYSIVLWASDKFYSLTALHMLEYIVLTDIWDLMRWQCWATKTCQACKHFYNYKKKRKTFLLSGTRFPPALTFKHNCMTGCKHFLLILMSPWIFWCAKFSQWQRLLQVLIVTTEKTVTGFPVWTICMVSFMIASWFSIARKCEVLPPQSDVCPTSTNPQLMASRSNRPQQPHILQRLHVHNSPARLKKVSLYFTKIQ